MKIAILTLPIGFNYGGVLQCYALCSVLRGMGHDVSVLNLSIEDRVPLKVKVLRCGSLVKCCYLRYIKRQKEIGVSNPFRNAYFKDQRWKLWHLAMKDFIREKIHLTQTLYNSDELSAYCKAHSFDAYIVGSDQVWREIYTKNITDYFLGFLPQENQQKKIVYAASTEHSA